MRAVSTSTNVNVSPLSITTSPIGSIAIDGPPSGVPPSGAGRLTETIHVAAVRAAAARHLTARDLWVAIIAPNARALADAIAANAPSPITYDSPKPEAVMTEDREIAAFPLSVRPDDVRVIPLDRVFRERDWLRPE